MIKMMSKVKKKVKITFKENYSKAVEKYFKDKKMMQIIL